MVKLNKDNSVLAIIGMDGRRMPYASKIIYPKAIIPSIPNERSSPDLLLYKVYICGIVMSAKVKAPI